MQMVSDVFYCLIIAFKGGMNGVTRLNFPRNHSFRSVCLSMCFMSNPDPVGLRVSVRETVFLQLVFVFVAEGSLK